MTSTILIYGSCVSRDPFDHPIISGSGTTISTYISKTGIISQASQQIDTLIEAPEGEDFLSRMVRIDAAKLLPTKLKEHKSDWLLLDFIDDRLPLIQVGKTYFTASRGFVQSGLSEQLKGLRFDPVAEENFETWASAFAVVAEDIKNAGFHERNIILHRAWWARYFRKDGKTLRFDEKTLASCARHNLFLGKIYREVKRHFPKSAQIEVPADYLFADAEHKWGLDPYHYVPEYNREVSNQLLAILDGEPPITIPPAVSWQGNTPATSTAASISTVNRRLQPGVSIYDKSDARNPIVKEYSVTRPYLTHAKERVEKFKDAGITFDEDGVPQNVYRWGGPYYYSVTIGHHGISCVARYIADKKEEDLKGAISVAKWLMANQSDDGSWPVLYDHDWYPGRCAKLKSPWTSAMGQGLCISFLTRLAAIGDVLPEVSSLDLLDAAEKALNPFTVPVSEGGVRAMLFDRFPWYEEYPTNPSSFVLNGFVYAILGPYDFAEYTGSEKAREIYRAGIESLKIALPLYDLGRCTAYDLTHVTTGKFSPNIARQSYHFIHVQLLSVLNLLEGGNFDDVVERWHLYLKGWGAKHN
jgi:hypothetical protein